MASRIAVLKKEIEEREKEIAQILQEEEANKAREALARSKAVRIAEEPSSKRLSLAGALSAAIDAGDDCIFADQCVKKAEAKVAEYEGFATMGAYEAYEVLEQETADALAVQRKWYPCVHDVLVAMRDSERERDRYLEKLGLELETLKKVIGV